MGRGLDFGIIVSFRQERDKLTSCVTCLFEQNILSNASGSVWEEELLGRKMPSMTKCDGTICQAISPCLRPEEEEMHFHIVVLAWGHLLRVGKLRVQQRASVYSDAMRSLPVLLKRALLMTAGSTWDGCAAHTCPAFHSNNPQNGLRVTPQNPQIPGLS